MIDHCGKTAHKRMLDEDFIVLNFPSLTLLTFIAFLFLSHVQGFDDFWHSHRKKCSLQCIAEGWTMNQTTRQD